MADHGHSRDSSIDSVLSEGSSTSIGGTPRRAHPALFPRQISQNETQGTIRASRLASPPSRKNTGTGASPFDTDNDAESPALNASRRNGNKPRNDSVSPTPSTPSNTSAGRRSTGKYSSSRRARLKTRKSVDKQMGASEEDDSSDSGGEGLSERMFEQAFQRYDPNNKDEIAMDDFLHFFDTLQSLLPPLSDPLLDPEIRTTMLGMMTQAMANSNGPIYISRDDMKNFYSSLAGKALVDELNDRRQGNLKQDMEISNLRGRLQMAAAEKSPEMVRRNTQNNLSPERRTPYGGHFARPIGPRRGTSSVLSGEGSELDDGSHMAPIDSSQELTGNFLASSTPNQPRRTLTQGYFSPGMTSPTNTSASFGDFPMTRRDSDHPGGMMSPGFSISAKYEAQLRDLQQLLVEKQAAYDELEQELSDLRMQNVSNKQDFEEELTSAHEESRKLTGQLELRRKDIERLKIEKEQLQGEIEAYGYQIESLRKQMDSLQNQHSTDRDAILTLTQENSKVIQQSADAAIRVEALTMDLKELVREKEEMAIQQRSLQKKADMVSIMGQQIKTFKDEQKDRETEIQLLKAEVNRRQLDIDMITAGQANMLGTNGTASGKGRVRDGIGPRGLLSDELETAGITGSESEEDGGTEEDEEEEVVTTTKTIKRRKRAQALKKADISSDGTAPEVEEVFEKVVETSDRAIQAEIFMAEMGTGMDGDLPGRPIHTGIQTDISVETGMSLEDHIQGRLPPPPKYEMSMDEDAFEKISAYEVMAQKEELTRKQLEELGTQIGVQSEVIERFKKLGEANARSQLRKNESVRAINTLDPLDWLNHSTFWLQKWFNVKTREAYRMYILRAEKPILDEDAKYLAENSPPSFSSVLALIGFLITFLIMLCIIGVYTWRWNKHEAMWRKLNTLNDYNGIRSSGFFNGRTWRILKYDIQKRLTKRRIPV